MTVLYFTCLEFSAPLLCRNMMSARCTPTSSMVGKQGSTLSFLILCEICEWEDCEQKSGIGWGVCLPYRSTIFCCLTLLSFYSWQLVEVWTSFQSLLSYAPLTVHDDAENAAMELVSGIRLLCGSTGLYSFLLGEICPMSRTDVHLVLHGCRKCRCRTFTACERGAYEWQ